MPRTTETVTISLPIAFRRRLEKMVKNGNRTRSDVMCRALLAYFAESYPAVEATKSEMAGIRQSRDEIARGEYLTLEQLNESLANSRSKTNRKKNSQNCPTLNSGR